MLFVENFLQKDALLLRDRPERGISVRQIHGEKMNVERFPCMRCDGKQGDEQSPEHLVVAAV